MLSCTSSYFVSITAVSAVNWIAMFDKFCVFQFFDMVACLNQHLCRMHCKLLSSSFIWWIVADGWHTLSSWCEPFLCCIIHWSFMEVVLALFWHSIYQEWKAVQFSVSMHVLLMSWLDHWDRRRMERKSRYHDCILLGQHYLILLQFNTSCKTLVFGNSWWFLGMPLWLLLVACCERGLRTHRKGYVIRGKLLCCRKGTFFWHCQIKCML